MYFRAAKESRIPIGNGCSGIRRYATLITATLARETICLQMWDSVLRSPSAQPILGQQSAKTPEYPQSYLRRESQYVPAKVQDLLARTPVLRSPHLGSLESLHPMSSQPLELGLWRMNRGLNICSAGS